MFRAGLCSLVASILVPTLAVQVLQEPSNRPWQDKHPDVLNGRDCVEWSVDKPPNPNATDHLVFETAYSLLQHWPNTRMRNGHNIVPGTIPKGTLLYHGTNRKKVPMGPEWVSMDPEHSHYFCRKHLAAMENSRKGCFHLALAVSRPLKVIYFDGNSAAKLPYGPLDTQNLLAWGKSCAEDLWDEAQRVEDLCRWGKKFGVDGFVRMEMAFEVILCDFTSGVRVVSFPNIERPQGVPPHMSKLANFESLHAGSWHNHVPGETRIQLDLAGMVSFYDTQLVPSLVATRGGQGRWDHRVQNISGADLSAVVSRLEAALVRPSDSSSGIDWKALLQVVIDRYAGRLELTRHLLNSPATSPDDVLDLANKTHTQLRVMLAPYLLLSATPTDPSSDTAPLDWAAPVYELCSTTHTDALEPELNVMTDSEKLLFRAVRGTNQEICRVVTKMWAAGVHAGLDPSLNTKGSLRMAKVTRVRNAWADDLNRLMAWLDWSVWVKCDPSCSPEEICYLPTWPFGFPRFPYQQRDGGRKPPPVLNVDASRAHTLTSFQLQAMGIGNSATKDALDAAEIESDAWIRPKPKCIRRLDPYDAILRV